MKNVLQKYNKATKRPHLFVSVYIFPQKNLSEDTFYGQKDIFHFSGFTLLLKGKHFPLLFLMERKNRFITAKRLLHNETSNKNSYPILTNSLPNNNATEHFPEWCRCRYCLQFCIIRPLCSIFWERKLYWHKDFVIGGSWLVALWKTMDRNELFENVELEFVINTFLAATSITRFQH